MKIKSQTEGSTTDVFVPTWKRVKSINVTNFDIDLKTDKDSERADSIMDQVYTENSTIDGDSKREGY